MRDAFESRVIAAKPDEVGNAKFVAQTMQAVRRQAVRETFEGVLRTTNVTKKEHLYMKLKHLPKFAVVGLAILGITLTGGAAYAAYKWLAPEVTVLNETKQNDDNKREYTVNIENCGVTVGGTPISDGEQRFEVVKDSTLTQEQVKKVLQDTCAYQQLIEFSNDHWRQTEYGSIKKGDTVITYGAFDQTKYDIGRVTALTTTSITIETTVYSELANGGLYDPAVPTPYFPEGKLVTSTYPLPAQPEYWYQGSRVNQDTVQVGDAVYLQVRNRSTAKADNDMTMNQDTKADVVGVTKVDIDTGYVQSAPFIGNPALVGQIFQLVGCEGSKEYLCLSVNSQSHSEYVYAHSGLVEGIPFDRSVEEASAYFRKDMPENPTGYSHTIQGRIHKLDGKYMTLFSRGTVNKIEIELPYDVIGSYNKTNDSPVEQGDFIQIDYMQKQREDQQQIKPGDVYRIMLMQYQLPDGTYKKY